MTTTQKSRPGGEPEAAKSICGDTPIVATERLFSEAATRSLTQFAQRMIQEALETAMPSFWLARADVLEAARPTLGEFRGQATSDDLRRRWEALTEAGEACRERAEFLRRYPDPVAAAAAAEAMGGEL